MLRIELYIVIATKIALTKGRTLLTQTRPIYVIFRIEKNIRDINCSCL